jgi:23S rRNA (adenine2503-C2)-methyltransferase
MEKSIDFYNHTKKEMRDLCLDENLPPFRGDQIFRWIYKSGAKSFTEMKNIPKAIKEKYELIQPLKTVDTKISKDLSIKFLFYTKDNFPVESVLIPSYSQKGKLKYTICLSTQSGCSMGCVFCATAQLGLNRNLTTGEIVSQVLLTMEFLDNNKMGDLHERPREQWISNIVYMGMGEPLLNINNLISSIVILKDNDGLSFSGRKITVSTCGILPGLKKLGENEDLKINLAISLNGTNDELRDQLMPVNEKYPLKDLFHVLRSFPLSNRQRITFEYIMFQEVNDTIEDAKALIKLISGIPAKINIIPYNLWEKEIKIGTKVLNPSTKTRRDAFANYLNKAGYTVIERRSSGKDIKGACGQLAGSI